MIADILNFFRSYLTGPVLDMFYPDKMLPLVDNLQSQPER